MAMKIFKSYNHKILSENQQLIDFCNVNNLILETFYDNHLFDPLNFTNKKSNYKIKKYNREPIGSILYDKVGCKQYSDEYQLINTIEKNKSLLTINMDNVKKYYPSEWRNCLPYYDISFMSYIFIQFLEYECDKLIKLSNEKHKINIIYSSKISTDKNVDDVIYHVLNIVEWLINKYKPDHNLVLNILLTPMEKTYSSELKKDLYELYEWAKWTKDIPCDGLKPFNINTGVSWLNNIIIFRSDELFKVLIHELLHNLKLDINCSTCNHVVNNNLNFNVGNENSYPVLYNEAYVEYNAIFLWIFYLTQYYNDETMNKKKLFCHMICREIINGAINCKKLFDYYKITDFEIFKDPNDIVQYTNAFSYIFIKYLMLINTYPPDIRISYDNEKNTRSVKLNQMLKTVFDQIHHYNYLFNINTIKNCNKLKLSLYNIKSW